MVSTRRLERASTSWPPSNHNVCKVGIFGGKPWHSPWSFPRHTPSSNVSYSMFKTDVYIGGCSLLIAKKYTEK